jgi:hypothetical protein
MHGENRSWTKQIREYRKTDRDKRGVHSIKNGVGLSQLICPNKISMNYGENKSAASIQVSSF